MEDGGKYSGKGGGRGEIGSGDLLKEEISRGEGEGDLLREGNSYGRGGGEEKNGGFVEGGDILIWKEERKEMMICSGRDDFMGEGDRNRNLSRH